jgi:anhydro-N-acetylmuramic acid kinase
MHKAAQLAVKKKRLIIGLMSGTSADGVDAALVEIEGAGVGSFVEVRAWNTYPYPPGVREEVLRLSAGSVCPARDISELNFRLGGLFADAALELCGSAAVEVSSVDLIGSHGQTIFHMGPGGAPGRFPSTLQIGEPCVIAERTGVTVVADFRPRDMAAGGQGAPLVPMADYIMFASQSKSRCMLNLGGVANVTFLPKGCDPGEVRAFDTGPGNAVLDSLAGVFSGGAIPLDDGGELAMKGAADGSLLDRLLGHPFFKLAPPKSTGRDTFGESFARNLADEGRGLGLSDADIMMTAVSLTVRGVVDACRDHFPSESPIDEVIVSGGGVHNEALMTSLKKGLGGNRVISVGDLGVDPDAKEAVAFAVLANETICGNAGNLPSATGAAGAVVLGKIVP